MAEIESDKALVLIEAWMGERIRRQLSPEDIWQEALCLAWRDREQHEWVDLRCFRAWLLQIARHRLLDACDRIDAQKRGGGLLTRSIPGPGDSVGGSVLADMPVGGTTPSVLASDAERARAMRAALDSLPDELRTVIWLYLFEEKRMSEVAEAVGVSLATAKRRFLDASQRYRKALQGQLGTRVEGSFHKR